MQLSCRVLDNVKDVNHWTYITQARFTAGDGPALYFQLIDVSDSGHCPACNTRSGKRYIPASGATLQVIVDNVDQNLKITRYASQPFPSDGSIWMIQFMPTDPIVGTASLRLTLTETGPKVTRGSAKNVVSIDTTGPNSPPGVPFTTQDPFFMG